MSPGCSATSARAVAQDAGTVNGSIFYYFGSMDGLLAATANALADRGIARILTPQRLSVHQGRRPEAGYAGREAKRDMTMSRTRRRGLWGTMGSPML